MKARRLFPAAGACALVVAMAGCTQPWKGELASVNAAGSDSGNHDSQNASVSPDGTKVAFQSDASDLVADDTNGATDVFVRDLTTGTTTLVSASSAGTGSGSGPSAEPQFSPDGSKVLFTSRAGDLVAGQECRGDSSNLFVWDLAAGTTSLVAEDADGECPGDWSGEAVFSADGTRVAFTTEATGFGGPSGPTDFNFKADVVVADLATGTTTVVSVNAAGDSTGNNASTEPAINADGTAVAFTSGASDLGPADEGFSPDVYLRDLTTGTTALISSRPDGHASRSDSSRSPAISPDGSKVAFASNATDLGPTDTNDCPDISSSLRSCSDIYLRDVAAGETTLVSVNAAGTDSANYSISPAFSPDGTKLLFESYAPDLLASDTNQCNWAPAPHPPVYQGCWDIFLHDLAAGTNALVSINGAGTASGNENSNSALFSPDGKKIAFVSTATDLGPKDSNAYGDIYVRDLTAGSTTMASVRADGNDSAGSGGTGPSIGGDTVGFATQSSNIGPTDTNNRLDIYVARPR